jgi:hypothetical protein
MKSAMFPSDRFESDVCRNIGTKMTMRGCNLATAAARQISSCMGFDSKIRHLVQRDKQFLKKQSN